MSPAIDILEMKTSLRFHKMKTLLSIQRMSQYGQLWCYWAATARNREYRIN